MTTAALPDYRATGPFVLPGVAFTVDCRRDGQYISVECQAGAHHGCPGGIRETAGTPALVCDCPVITCACRRPLRLHLASST
ncbi:hypothetical protein F4556_005225 [Kitasatospora gansuensis]|uniref:Uncharacterized protein n=1 Tax=Kitasatospora gansuensis TaxID=258050 RepID=A0A7W7SFV1_9ACTN|nr:hypothetical protein [Kitasatospora gansuensis]MBB4949690.1 hypothetical protein [Kitasatospora gansuensis]